MIQNICFNIFRVVLFHRYKQIIIQTWKKLGNNLHKFFFVNLEISESVKSFEIEIPEQNGINPFDRSSQTLYQTKTRVHKTTNI